MIYANGERIKMITAEELKKANKQIKTIELKNKKGGVTEYAEVHQRISAFKSVFPDYSIITTIVSMNEERATFMARIEDPDGRVLATGHASEAKKEGYINPTSYVENCETSAVGRALGNFGIGIKSAFASANEMVNAIRQEQEDIAKAQENPNAPINKRQKDSIYQHCAEDGVSIDDICDFMAISEIDVMTIPQYWTLIQKWSETVKKIKAMQRVGR